MMNAIDLDGFQDSDVDVDLRRCPPNRVVTLLDLAQFDRFLDYVYITLLKREPDRDGRLHYRALTREGLTRPAIVHRLLRSREYKASSIEAAGLGADDFVRRAYQDILGRWPDQAGLDTYRRIAAKPNGRRKVLMNLSASAEAVRRNGGRLARIDGLRRYARAGWLTRLPVIGPWFARQRELRQRVDRISLNQYLLARQIASLQEEIEAVSLAGPDQSGFIDEAPGTNQIQDNGTSAAIFLNALTRARREA